jgi:hypothetical protein
MFFFCNGTGLACVLIDLGVLPRWIAPSPTGIFVTVKTPGPLSIQTIFLHAFSFLSSPYVCTVRSEKKVACSQLVSLCSRTKPPLLVCYAYDLHKKDRLEGFACGVKYYSSINRVRCVMSLLLSVRHKNQKNTDRKEPFG